jgi:hypothetical protein
MTQYEKRFEMSNRYFQQWYYNGTKDWTCVRERQENQRGALRGRGGLVGAVVEEEVVVEPRRGTSLGFCSEDAECAFTMQVFLQAIQMGLSLFLYCTVLLDLFLLRR